MRAEVAMRREKLRFMRTEIRGKFMRKKNGRVGRERMKGFISDSFVVLRTIRREGRAGYLMEIKVSSRARLTTERSCSRISRELARIAIRQPSTLPQNIVVLLNMSRCASSPPEKYLIATWDTVFSGMLIIRDYKVQNRIVRSKIKKIAVKRQAVLLSDNRFQNTNCRILALSIQTFSALCD